MLRRGAGTLLFWLSGVAVTVSTTLGKGTMNLFAKIFSFLPFVMSTVQQVESDLQGKSSGEKRQAALDSLKGAGQIAAIADGKDADSIAQATDAAGKTVDAVERCCRRPCHRQWPRS